MPAPARPAVCLTDFGLAKATATGSKFTRTGQALGTPAYMSPEQARGETAGLTSATDVWSLGCVLHEMLTGRPPFAGDSPAAVVGRVLTAEPARIRTLRPDVPTGVDAVVRVALAKLAGDRHPSVRDLRDDLDRVLRSERPRARVPRARRPWAVAALGGAAAACLVALAWPRAPVTPGPASDTEPSEAARLAAQAKSLRTTDPREAARLLERALVAESSRHAWRIERGLLLWAVGEGQSARDEWGRVPHGAPEAALARLYTGLEAFFRWEKTGFATREAGADLLVAAEAEGQGRRLVEAARAALRQEWRIARDALRGEPGWEAALLRAYVEGADPAGDPGAAVRDYDAALAEGIPFAWAWNNRGAARVAQADLAGAIADYETALRLRPEYPEALSNRAFARQAQGDLAGAIRDCDAALEMRPDYPEARNHRGLARQAQSDLAGAIADYDAALRLRPDFPEALCNRGNARRAAGDPEGAIGDFSGALGLRPAYPKALANRGNARQAQGDLVGAIADYDAALHLRPETPEVLVNRGIARRAQGNLAGAIDDYRDALRVRPGFAEAQANLGFAQRDLRDWRAAADACREFLRLAPQHASAETIRRLFAECEEKARAEEAAKAGGR